ncbi:MAG: RNA-binding cell elongation regulator Jag/EloR [Peptoniphilus sp.]|uniref:RNA-binding cell elongation regulator Jag/EloR n=1 Tax=Peptoniphilus sp. TaxID=1971214 RepID=UPI002A74EAD4|nr:RNA-binding cell elongation regulator Jag/EloR [Peptoniphilus sp.]MDY2987250.1 RNA-binding cell elongation regulator Jag/EloR [Peptoniphilus sp.]
MNYVIKTAKTVDEAVSQALIELNINREDAQIEVIEESSKGLFGLIGSKNATVKVSKIEATEDILKEIFTESEKSQPTDEFENKVSTEEITTSIQEAEDSTDKKSAISGEIEEISREFLDKVLNSLGIETDLDINFENNVLKVEIKGDEEKLGIVIGKRGVTLDSIQYLLSLIVNKNTDEYVRVQLDSSGYRQKREDTLKDLAQKMASKVLKTGRNIKLEPMNAHERKIIHEALQEYEGVITHSEGKDPYRKVVIQKERKY